MFFDMKRLLALALVSLSMAEIKGRDSVLSETIKA